LRFASFGPCTDEMTLSHAHARETTATASHVLLGDLSNGAALIDLLSPVEWNSPNGSH
jgi:hypothetical protein